MHSPKEHGRRSLSSSFGSIWKTTERFSLSLLFSDGDAVSAEFSTKTTVEEVLLFACRSKRVEHPRMFGLAQFIDNEYYFLKQKKTLLKYLPRSIIVTEALQHGGKALQSSTEFERNEILKTCRLYCRIKHFAIDIQRLLPATLKLCYDQLAGDMVKAQNIFQLQGLQVVYGDLAKMRATMDEGREWRKALEDNPLKYLPSNAAQDTLSRLLLEASPGQDLDEQQLMQMFIRECMKLPYYGEYFYDIERIQDDEHDELENCMLGIGCLGLSVLQTKDRSRKNWKLVSSWSWSDIHSCSITMREINVYWAFSCRREMHILFEDEKRAKYVHEFIKESGGFREHISIPDENETKQRSSSLLQRATPNLLGSWRRRKSMPEVSQPHLRKAASPLTSRLRSQSTLSSVTDKLTVVPALNQSLTRMYSKGCVR